MTSIPNDRHYTSHHVWLKPDGDQLVIGITEHAQEALGDIEAIDLPAVGSTITAGAMCGSLESAKTVSDLVAPISAEVIAHNEEVIANPLLANDEPYGDGWLFRLSKISDDAMSALLDAGAYAELITA